MKKKKIMMMMKKKKLEKKIRVLEEKEFGENLEDGSSNPNLWPVHS